MFGIALSVPRIQLVSVFMEYPLEKTILFAEIIGEGGVIMQGGTSWFMTSEIIFQNGGIQTSPNAEIMGRDNESSPNCDEQREICGLCSRESGNFRILKCDDVQFDRLVLAASSEYSDTSANEDNSFRNHIR